MEQRRSRRFNLRLPVEVVRAGANPVSHLGETYNVSAGGVLITDPGSLIEIGQHVEYYLALPSTNGSAVRIRCLGKIVRRDDEKQALAATLERYEFIRS